MAQEGILRTFDLKEQLSEDVELSSCSFSINSNLSCIILMAIIGTARHADGHDQHGDGQDPTLTRGKLCRAGAPRQIRSQTPSSHPGSLQVTTVNTLITEKATFVKVIHRNAPLAMHTEAREVQ